MQSKNMVVLGLALAIVFTTGVVVGAQPHMQNALGALQNASSQLQQASANKGGHRERAMELVNQAMAEVRAGMAYAGK